MNGFAKAAHDLNLGAFNFRSCLRLIASVGEESRSAPGYRQSSAGTGESGEIANVGKMGDEKARKASFGDAATEQSNAVNVIHRESIAGGR